MKTTTVLTIAALAASAVSAQEFSAADKALWIDRHNYFRMTALPFSAANMLRIKWSDDLATAATAEAKGCAAVTGVGINAHTHSDGAAATSIVDAAFQEWAVAAAVKALPNVPAPKVAGDAVGTNVYSSYSQIVWASTNQVGCGYATCTTGKLVVCKYAPAGNTASEPWYIHGPPNTQCPAGTEGKQGLCIVPGDAGNNDIAAIPAGQNAYDAFASFVGTMQKVLKGETVDAGPISGTSASTNPGSAAATTTAAPGAAATTAPATNAAAAAAAGTTNGAGATTTTTAPTAGATDATTAGTSSTGAAATTTSGSSAAAVTSGGASTEDAISAATTTGSSSSGDETNAAKSISFGSLTTGSDGTPGTVRAGSNTGSTFTNGAAAANGGSPSTAAATAQNAESTAKSNESTTTTANNKSGEDTSDGPSFSAAGIAGIIVVGCAMVAGFAVFVSYRKNQRRQRDIMQNGGIHIL